MINEKLRQTLIYNSIKGINTTLDTDVQRDIVNVISALEKKCYDLLTEKVQHHETQSGGCAILNSSLEGFEVESIFSPNELALSEIDLINTRKKKHEERLVKEVIERLRA